MDMKHIVLFVLLPSLLREKASTTKAKEALNARDSLTHCDPLRELGDVDPRIEGLNLKHEEQRLLQNDFLQQETKCTTILTTNVTTVYHERNETRKGVDNTINTSIKRILNRRKRNGDKAFCPNGKEIDIFGGTATKFYSYGCPNFNKINMTEPCPRIEWKTATGTRAFVAKNPDGRPKYYHYWFMDLKVDTLYDWDPLFSDDYESGKEEDPNKSFRYRIHTCAKADKLHNLMSVSYGLGWIYFTWRAPMENCWGMTIYKWEYSTSNGTFSQDYVGTRKVKSGLFQFKKFHPCPTYPNWYCFIISENIIPFTELTFKVAYERFFKEEKGDVDISPWTSITTKTDDKESFIIFCPPVTIWNKLWLLILLIVIFLILLLIACILIGLLQKRKRHAEMEEDEGFEEESIPPSNVFEKIWERLKNFFNQLCPRPKKPPPPPPPPPEPPKKKKPKKPKPKPKPKPKKKKPKPKPMPKPKPKPESPKVSPVEPPKIPPKKKEESPSPPPPPPRKPKKPRRGGRPEKAGRAAQSMDTRRAASGVGGIRGRRRR